MTSRRGLLVATSLVLLSVAGCAGRTWDAAGAARSVLERAANRSLAERSATLRGVDTERGSVIVRFAGRVDFADDEADLVTETVGSTLAPFDGRWVNGWTYLEMPRGQLRPPTVPRSVQWLAFHVRRFRGSIPVPGPTISPGLPAQMLRDLVTGNYSAQRVPYPDASVAAYRVSHLDSAARGVTALVRAGAVVGFDSTGNGDPALKLTFVNSGGRVHVEPPPAFQTRVIPPNANLYQRPVGA